MGHRMPVPHMLHSCGNNSGKVNHMFKVKVDSLARLLNAASTEQTRYYLNGVFVTKRNDQVVLVATDGHIMAIEHDPFAECEKPAILATGAIKQIVAASKLFEKSLGKNLSKMIKRQIFVEVATDDSRRVVLRAGSGMQAVSIVGSIIVDGSFPDWTRVIPQVTAENTAIANPFNPELLERLARTIPDQEREPKIQMFQNGCDAPIAVRSVEDWCGVLMPMCNSFDQALPSFLAPKIEPVGEKAAA